MSDEKITNEVLKQVGNGTNGLFLRVMAIQALLHRTGLFSKAQVEEQEAKLQPLRDEFLAKRTAEWLDQHIQRRSASASRTIRRYSRIGKGGYIPQA